MAKALRGAGPVVCCGGHRDRCLFGHMHIWHTYYRNGRLVRTADTFECSGCGGVCTAEEEGDEAGEPVEQPDPITPEVYAEFFPERDDAGAPLAAEQPEPAAEIAAGMCAAGCDRPVSGRHSKRCRPAGSHEGGDRG